MAVRDRSASIQIGNKDRNTDLPAFCIPLNT